MSVAAILLLVYQTLALQKHAATLILHPTQADEQTTAVTEPLQGQGLHTGRRCKGTMQTCDIQTFVKANHKTDNIPEMQHAVSLTSAKVTAQGKTSASAHSLFNPIAVTAGTVMLLLTISGNTFVS